MTIPLQGLRTVIYPAVRTPTGTILGFIFNPHFTLD